MEEWLCAEPCAESSSQVCCTLNWEVPITSFTWQGVRRHLWGGEGTCSESHSKWQSPDLKLGLPPKTVLTSLTQPCLDPGKDTGWTRYNAHCWGPSNLGYSPSARGSGGLRMVISPHTVESVTVSMTRVGKLSSPNPFTDYWGWFEWD